MIAILILGIFLAVVFGKNGVALVKGVVLLLVGLMLILIVGCAG